MATYDPFHSKVEEANLCPTQFLRTTAVYDPLHYLALLEHKSRVLEQVAPLAGWPLPDRFPTLRRLLEARLNKHVGYEYIQVLRLPDKGGEKTFYYLTRFSN